MNHHRNLLLIFATIILLLLMGGGVLWWQGLIAEREKNAEAENIKDDMREKNKNSTQGNSPEEKLYSGLGVLLKAHKEGDDIKVKLRNMGLEYEPDNLPISIIAEDRISNSMIDYVKNIGGDVAWFKEYRMAVNASIDIIERLASQSWVRYIFLSLPPSPL